MTRIEDCSTTRPPAGVPKVRLSRSRAVAAATVAPIPISGTGDAGFASQMTLTSSGQKAYFDACYAVRGAFATFLGWYTGSALTSEFEQMAAKALAKL